MKCQCLTLQGLPCKRSAVTGSSYCSTHKNCKKTTKTSPKKTAPKRSAKKTTPKRSPKKSVKKPSSKETIALPPTFTTLKTECVGEWGMMCPAPSRGDWPDKATFIQRIEKIQQELRGEMPLRKTGHCCYCEEKLSRHQYKLGGVCWTEGFTDHYLRVHNVMPTKELFEAISNY